MAEFFRDVASPLLDRLDSETWHKNAVKALHLAEQVPGGLTVLDKFNHGGKRFTDPRLGVSVPGLETDNPTFVGAGYTKSGVGFRGLHALGFGGGEAGTIVLRAQEGNPKPRQEVIRSIRRDTDRLVSWNWLGFNQPGDAEEIADNLVPYMDLVVGASIGTNKGTELKDVPNALSQVIRIVLPYEIPDQELNEYYQPPRARVKYLAFNPASPNTPELRKQLGKQSLRDSTQAIAGTMTELGIWVPYFIKFSPDMSQQEIDDALQVAVDEGAAGVIVANTTVDSKIKRRHYTPKIQAKYGQTFLDNGGIAGDDPDYIKRCEWMTAYAYKEVGDKLVIMGTGGVNSRTAAQRIRAGATILKEVTNIRVEGTAAAGKTNKALVAEIERTGVDHYTDLVGVDVDRILANAPKE